MSLSRYAEDFDLPEPVRANKARINGLRVKIKGDVFPPTSPRCNPNTTTARRWPARC